jgi:hypothetical protein
MRVKPERFQYQGSSPFAMFLSIAKYELDNIDEFLNLAKKARRSQQQSLERIAAKSGGNTPDDWLADDFAQLDDFASLSAEFAIIGLWRCIELYRKRAIRVACSPLRVPRPFRTNSPFACGLGMTVPDGSLTIDSKIMRRIKANRWYRDRTVSSAGKGRCVGGSAPGDGLAEAFRQRGEHHAAVQVPRSLMLS